MGVYNYDAINDELVPIAGTSAEQGLSDKVSKYSADSTYWDTTPTSSSTKPVTSGGILTDINSKVLHENLLDNPWFTVNQRGVTNAWSTQFTYGVDRWLKQTANNTLQVTNDGISAITSSAIGLYQIYKQSTIKDLYGKMLTFSIMYGDGIIESGSDLLPLDHYNPSSTKVKTFLSNTTRCNYIRIETYTNGNTNIVFNTKEDTVIKAVKLEIGEVSTLHLDTVPNYQQELAKCQRYFVRLEHASLGMAICRTVDYFDALISIPVPMRTVPSATYNGSIGFVLSNNITRSEIESISVWDENPITHVGCSMKKTGATIGEVGRVYATSNSYIDFSADL